MRRGVACEPGGSTEVQLVGDSGSVDGRERQCWCRGLQLRLHFGVGGTPEGVDTMCAVRGRWL
jgi:fructose-1,6-bisphosphatase/sedoheptulose 1,7-bisphosphatase-like protein